MTSAHISDASNGRLSGVVELLLSDEEVVSHGNRVPDTCPAGLLAPEIGSGAIQDYSVSQVLFGEGDFLPAKYHYRLFGQGGFSSTCVPYQCLGLSSTSAKLSSDA